MLRSLYEVLHEKRWKSSLAFCLSALALGLALTSCDSNSPKAAADAEKKATPPTAPAIPDEYQDAAKTMLGSDSEVLLFGDLAKNGKQEVLARKPGTQHAEERCRRHGGDSRRYRRKVGRREMV